MKWNRFVTALLGLSAVTLASFATAEVPQVITIQGRLTDSLGGTVTDSDYQITFTIYDSEGGGSLLWTSSAQTVPVSGGLFVYYLGSATPLPADLFAGDTIRYLGIQIDADPEMTPRTRLTSGSYVYHALRSDTATYALSAAGGGGSGGWTDDGNVVRLETGADSVGIGTTTPSAKLDVEGDVVISGKATIGPDNTNTGHHAFVAGQLNTVDAMYATVSGGLTNQAGAAYATVGGGQNDTAGGAFSTIGGGHYNTASGNYSTIAGGTQNTTIGQMATVGGGRTNNATGAGATIAGGQNNQATGDTSAVGGGFVNQAIGDYSVVGGGDHNMALGTISTVGGGANNRAEDSASTIGGGSYNYARGVYSVVAGGGGPAEVDSNLAGGNQSSVGGGRRNVASGSRSVVAGGDENAATSTEAVVSGGGENVASHMWATVSGGAHVGNGIG